MRRRPWRSSRAAAVAALALAGCVTEGPEAGDAAAAPDAVAPEAPPKPSGGTTRTTATVAPAPVDDFEFGRMLIAADPRADRFVAASAEPGEDARRERDLAQSALEAMTAQHLERLLAGAADRGDPTRRRICVKLLAFADDRRATAPVVAALQETSDPHLQTVAGFALSRLADANTPLEPLLAAAASPDPDVRVNSLLALWHVLEARGRVGNYLDRASRDRVLPVLETALFDPSDALARGHAAAAMGALADPRGVDPLLNLLRDKHPVVRTHTALALGKMGDRRAIRALLDVIDDTPRGTPRSAVLLGISVLLEREGLPVPQNLPDEQRPWEGHVERVLAEAARRPRK